MWALFSTDFSFHEVLSVYKARPTCRLGPNDGSIGKLSGFLSVDGGPLAARTLLHIKHTIKTCIQQNIKGINELLTLLLLLRKFPLQITVSMLLISLACQLLDVVYPGINSWVQAFKLN